MGVYKNFKTFVRKKIGMVGVAEFVDDAVQSNSKESWNSWFANPKFLHEYAEPRRLASFRQFVSLMEKHIDMNSATSAIDVGCGTGHLLMAIFEKYPAIKLTGTDFSEQAIAVAKQTMAQPEQSIQKTGRWGGNTLCVRHLQQQHARKQVRFGDLFRSSGTFAASRTCIADYQAAVCK